MPKPTSDCRATERKHPWPMVRLGDVCEFSRGLTYSKSDEVQVSSNVVLRSNNVDLGTGCLVFDELKYIRDSIEIPKSKRVSKGAILMCTANGSKQHLGKVALIDDDYDYAFGGFMGLLTPNDSINSRYLYWQLMSFEFKRHVTTLTDGTNINNLKFADIAQFTFPLPPLSVQREIVARLERELAVVEKIKKDFEALAETAKAEFKAELKEVFEGLKSGAVKMRRIGDVCENLDSRRIPIIKADRKSGEYPYYGASGIVDSVDNYIFDGDYLLVSEDGANLLARTTPIAFSVSGKIWVNNHAHILSFAEIDTQHFVEYFFASISVAEYVTGAAQPKLTQSALNDITLPLPALSIQRRVVGCLSAAKARAEKLEAKAQEGVSVCETMRKAILKEAFDSGR